MSESEPIDHRAAFIRDDRLDAMKSGNAAFPLFRDIVEIGGHVYNEPGDAERVRAQFAGMGLDPAQIDDALNIPEYVHNVDVRKQAAVVDEFRGFAKSLFRLIVRPMSRQFPRVAGSTLHIVDEYSMNADAIESSEHEPRVLVNTGTHMLGVWNRALRILATHPCDGLQSAERSVDAATAVLMARILSGGQKQSPLFSDFARPVWESLRSIEPESPVDLRTYFTQVTFLLAHEVGHIALGHTADRLAAVQQGRLIGSEQRILEEDQADRMAVRVALTLCNPQLYPECSSDQHLQREHVVTVARSLHSMFLARELGADKDHHDQRYKDPRARLRTCLAAIADTAPESQELMNGGAIDMAIADFDRIVSSGWSFLT